MLFAEWKVLTNARLIPQAACTKYGLMIGAKFAW